MRPNESNSPLACGTVWSLDDFHVASHLSLPVCLMIKVNVCETNLEKIPAFDLGLRGNYKATRLKNSLSVLSEGFMVLGSV